jgi:S-adenosylmethionine:tRNA ribosyltransferase-isomerase
MAALAQAGIAHETLTLHVGAGTFLPVKADDTLDHQMHAEWGRIEPKPPPASTPSARPAGGSSLSAPPRCAC